MKSRLTGGASCCLIVRQFLSLPATDRIKREYFRVGGLCQIEYKGHVYYRQYKQGPVEHFRCKWHKAGCKGELRLTNGLMTRGTTIRHNHKEMI